MLHTNACNTTSHRIRRIVVPGAGVEPAHPYEREILSLLCLPISPPGQVISAELNAERILTLYGKFSTVYA
jgi:hypothetical protein